MVCSNTVYCIPYINQEIFIQDFFNFQGFLFLFFFVPEPNVKMHFQVSVFLDSNENYMTMKIT